MTAVRRLKPVKGYLSDFYNFCLSYKRDIKHKHFFEEPILYNFNFSDTASLVFFAKLSQAPAPAGVSLPLFPNYLATPTDPTGQEYLFFANILTYTKSNLAKIKLSQVTFS